jgi:CheY-like chemotaxis protein
MLKIKGDGPLVLVDDDSDALSIALSVFELSKVKNPVLPLTSGEDLLSYLEEVKLGKASMPGMVLLDINMPSLSGFETLEALRTQECFENLPPIIAFTASNNPDDQRRALEAGANAYQVKPFGISDFLNFADSLV